MENNSFFKNLSKGIGKRLKFLSANPYKEVNLNWLTLKYYKHLPQGKIRTHQLFGKTLYFCRSTELIHGFDEIFLGEMYKQQLSSNPYIIDCGANIGLSIIYMKEHYPDAKIIAFEPDETNFALLSKNIASFGYTDIELRKVAVWNKDTTILFSAKGSTDSKITDSNIEESIEVPAFRLKNILNESVDFLKIDIEGAEYTVLNDIVDNLSYVKNLFVEYHGNFDQNHELTQILAMITSKGFSYYIKEAHCVYKTPFERKKNPIILYDIQLNIFCFRI